MDQHNLILIDETGSITSSLLESKHSKPGCLGQLRGPIAEWKNSTYNDHYYSKKLWERVFSLEWVKDAIRTRTLFGEADHPETRLEPSLINAAVVLTDYQFRDAEQDILGKFDILDTPSGRILYTLASYGSTLGVSSRGRGSLSKVNGRNTVDESSYTFGGFDIVATPAIKKARTEFISESTFNSMTESFISQVNECNKLDELKLMKGILNESGMTNVLSTIDAKIAAMTSPTPSTVVNESKPTEEQKELPEKSSKDTPIDNAIIEGLTNDLKKAYSRISELESTIDANAISIEESADSTKLAAEVLRDNAALNSVVGALKTDLKEKSELISKLKSQQAAQIIANQSTKVQEQVDINSSYPEVYQELKDLRSSHNSLIDKYNSLTSEHESLGSSYDRLKSDYNTMKIEYNRAEDTRTGLMADIQQLKQDNAQLSNQISELSKTNHKLQNQCDQLTTNRDQLITNCNKLTTEYDELTADYNDLVDDYNAMYTENSQLKYKYVEQKSTRIGMTPESLVKMLPEDYTLGDVDRLINSQLAMKRKVTNLTISAPIVTTNESSVQGFMTVPRQNDGLDGARALLTSMNR